MAILTVRHPHLHLEAAVVAVTSHPADGVDAQDFEAFGHDGCCSLAEQHPPHVHLHHLT